GTVVGYHSIGSFLSDLCQGLGVADVSGDAQRLVLQPRGRLGTKRSLRQLEQFLGQQDGPQLPVLGGVAALDLERVVKLLNCLAGLHFSSFSVHSPSSSSQAAPPTPGNQ